jgi:hypothetical protein
MKGKRDDRRIEKKLRERPLQRSSLIFEQEQAVRGDVTTRKLSVYMEIRSLPSLRDFVHVGVFCVHLVTYHQQQLGLPKFTAEQLLASAGGTVRCGRRYGPTIDTPPLSSSLTGQDAVLGRFSGPFGLCGYNPHSSPTTCSQFLSP